MKPKDLCSPFRWEERHPLFKDQVFYVPEYYHKHVRSLFPSFEEIFKNNHPVYIEYCSGNGEWIIKRAQENPEINWVAVELWFKRVRKIYFKRTNYKIDNLLIISGEGLSFSREYLEDHTVNEIYINFPDPWPKKRHAKHRLIQEPFVKELSRTVKKEGKVTIVTDDFSYKEQIEKEMNQWKAIEAPHKNYGSSFFERLWLSLDRNIYYLSYVNC